MSLPQIRAALKGCDRRDAAVALQMLNVMHAAMAPLMVGKPGTAIMEKCAAELLEIIDPKAKAAAKEKEGMKSMLDLVPKKFRNKLPKRLQKLLGS